MFNQRPEVGPEMFPIHIFVFFWLPLAGVLAMAPKPACAADVRLGLVVPGAGVLTKQVVSFRERRFESIVEQKTDFSCGAAALATVLRYAYGKTIGEDEVVEQMLKVSNPEQVRAHGFSLLDVKRYVETLGMRGRGYKVGIDALTEVRVPVIVLLDYRGYKHFVVLRRVTPTSVYLGDPALGNRVMTRKDFAEGWNGVLFAIIGQDYNRNTALMQPREPLTVKNVSTFRPLSDAEMVDFGFIRADYF